LSSLKPGDVIEIQGPPSSGKTHLLYSLLIDCTIPYSHQSTVLGGWNKVGIVFDMDGRFDVIRFNQLLLARLARLLSDSRIAGSIARESLGRLHLFRPTSSTQLTATIAHLPKYHAAHFPRGAIGLIAIDSMSALYWPDRFTAEQLQPASNLIERSKDAIGFSPSLHHILIALKLFHSTHGNMIVMTNWGLQRMSGTAPTIYKQHLNPFLNPFVAARPSVPRLVGALPRPSHDDLPLTYHITLSSTPSPRIQAGISMAEAKAQEANRRQTEEFIGLIRATSHSATDKLVFRVTSNTVVVD
jgi:DNA-repair protein XRCC2